MSNRKLITEKEILDLIYKGKRKIEIKIQFAVIALCDKIMIIHKSARRDSCLSTFSKS